MVKVKLECKIPEKIEGEFLVELAEWVEEHGGEVEFLGSFDFGNTTKGGGKAWKNAN